MKIKELIEKLNGYNPEDEVVLSYSACDPYYGCDQLDFSEVEFCKVYRKVEKKVPGKRKPVIEYEEIPGILELRYDETF